MDRLASSLVADIAEHLYPQELVALCNCNHHLHSLPEVWTHPSVDFSNRFTGFGGKCLSLGTIKRFLHSSVIVPRPYARMIFSYRVLYDNHGTIRYSYIYDTVIAYAIQLAIRHEDPTILYRYTGRNDLAEDAVYNLLGCYDSETYPKPCDVIANAIDEKVVPTVLGNIFSRNHAVLEARHFAAVFTGVPRLAHAFVPVLLKAYEHLQKTDSELFAVTYQDNDWVKSISKYIDIKDTPVNHALAEWRQQDRDRHEAWVRQILTTNVFPYGPDVIEPFLRLFAYHDNILMCRHVVQQLTCKAEIVSLEHEIQKICEMCRKEQ